MTINHIRMTLLLAAVGGCVTLLPAGGVSCRGETFPAPAIAAEDLPATTVDQLQTQAQQRADAMLSHMLLKLDELDRVCGLANKQRTKLKIAAKGAVDHALAKWLETTVEKSKQNAAQLAVAGVDIDMQANNGAFILRQQDKAGGQGIAVRAQRFVIFRVEGRVLQFPFGVPFVTVDFATLEQERVWQAALTKVLTLEQRQAMRAAQRERSALKRETLADLVIAELDRHLLLDAKQRERIAELVRPMYGERRLPRAGTSGENVAALADAVMRSHYANKLAEILSETQRARWQLTQQAATQPPGGGLGAPTNADDFLNAIEYW